MCKVRWQLMGMVLLMAIGGIAMGVGDVTTPGDPVIGQPNDNDWPAGEAPQYAIDNNVNTKFLHFRGNGDIAGIIITPQQGTSAPVSTIVQGLTFTSANDEAPRDPITYELYGSNGTAAAGPWTLINKGDIVDFNKSAEWPRLTKTTTPIFFSNSTAYLHYKVMFPTLRGGVNAIFQIAEIELIDEWLPSVAVNPAQKIIVLPETTVTVDATVTDIDSESWTYAWTQVSGPVTADFGGTESQQDPTITGLTARGTYVFQVVATDDDGNPSDPVQVKVRVWDTAVDQTLVAHWAFNEGSGTVATDSTTDKDNGVFGNNKTTDPNYTIPTHVEGWIPTDGANNYALNFTRFSYVEVTPDPNAVHDPNMKTLDGGVSVAAWVNADDWNGNRRIMQYGNPARSDEENIFRLLREGNGMRFVASSLTTRELTVPIFPALEWHHVAATYDGNTINIYIDGVLAGTKEFTTEAFLFPYTSQTVSIGCKNKNVTVAGDYMLGKLDDIRVYSYAIDQDTVRSLVGMGQNAAPSIVKITAPATAILTGATVINVDAEIYDADGDDITYKWEQISTGPAAAISATDVEDPAITFTEVGTYTFRLAINDDVYGVTNKIYREFTINIEQATCERVKTDGLLMVGDVNKDCRVDLDDLAEMAKNWLKCNDPEDPTCDNPYVEVVE